MTDVVIHMTVGKNGDTENGYRTAYSTVYGSLDSSDVFGQTLSDFFEGGGRALNLGFAAANVDFISLFDTVTWTRDTGGPITFSSSSFNYSDTGGPTLGYIGSSFNGWWTEGQTYTITFHKDAAPVPTVTLAVPTVIDGTGVLLEWAPGSLGSSIVVGYSVWRNGENVSGDLDSVTLTYSDQTLTPNTPFTYEIHMHLLEENDVISNQQVVTTGDLVEVFNCDCELVSTYDTLATLRTRMAIQCGYAAMSSNLPAGQATEFNEYLRTSQKQLYKKYFEQRTTRFFRWTMVPGERYYGINDSEGDCNLFADPLAIKWVGFEDLNRAWYQLVEGIDPVYYTRANINFGWPSRYEIRSCIEIFPAPQARYTLWVKADITLAPFSADADRTTIDDEAVLLFAVANWKAAKGKPAADVAMNQATARIQDLTARKHATYRYVPVTAVQNPATPPRFLPLGSQQS